MEEMIKKIKKCNDDQDFNYLVYYATCKRDVLMDLCEETRLYDYIDEEYYQKMRIDIKNVNEKLLWLAIVYKNYELMKFLSKRNIFFIGKVCTSKIKEVMDDLTFNIIYLNLCRVDRRFLINNLLLFLYYCDKEDHIKEDFKHNIKSYISSDKTFIDKFNIDVIRRLIELVNGGVISMIVFQKSQYDKDEFLKCYDLRLTDKYLMSLLTREIFKNNNIELFHVLENKNFQLHMIKPCLYVNSFKISIECLDKMSSLENFDDFINKHKDVILLNVSKEVKEYLMNKYF